LTMALQLIGAGMGRTGTASLKVALEDLGLGRCYHMSEILQNPERTQDWIDAANGNADWNKIFSDYRATVDNPGCGFWKELADYYPNAKVILTIRDSENGLNLLLRPFILLNLSAPSETVHLAKWCKKLFTTRWKIKCRTKILWCHSSISA
jgi:hypothetical protein